MYNPYTKMLKHFIKWDAKHLTDAEWQLLFGKLERSNITIEVAIRKATRELHSQLDKVVNGDIGLKCSLADSIRIYNIIAKNYGVVGKAFLGTATVGWVNYNPADEATIISFAEIDGCGFLDNFDQYWHPSIGEVIERFAAIINDSRKH